MFKKILFTALVLFGLSFRAVAGEYFGGEYFEKPADALVQLEKAEAAFKATIGGLPELEQAQTYEKDGNYRGAEDIYKTVVKNYPGSDYALQAQKKLIMLHISQEETQEANAAFDELIKIFSGHNLTPGTVYRIAEHATQQEKHKTACQLYQYVVDNWPKQYYEMWAQSGIAISNIALGKSEAAEAAVDKLLTDFYENDGIAATIYDIAYQYKRFEEYEKARKLYQYVLGNWPKSEFATWSKVGLAQSNIGLGETATAEKIIDGLVAGLDSNFPGDSNLPVTTAEAYYYAGDCYHSLGKCVKSTDCLKKVFNRCPDYKYAWNALFLVGENYKGLISAGVISKSEATLKIKAAYEQIVQKYPDCKAAGIAQEWLSRSSSK